MDALIDEMLNIEETVTRAQLIGMGAKMQQLGVDTVLVSQYGGCSPTCLPWQGKVYINDVFMDYDGPKGVSWGISRNGKHYMLLSYAVKNGLFHPNCRHHMGIYNEGITRIPPPLDKETVNRNYALEQQQRAMEREIRLLKRLENGTLDEEKKKLYTKDRKAAQDKLRVFIKENSDVLRRDLWRERLVPEAYNIDITEKGGIGNENGVFFGTNNVDLSYIKSNDYRRKFTRITSNTKVNNKIRDFISGALTKNNGTNTESLLVIDADTGEEVLRKTGRKNALGIELTDEEIARIKNYNGRKIGIHNHPTNLYPTGSDFVASGYREYEFGVIGTHDGKVYTYSAGNIPVRAEFIDRTIDSYMEKSYNKGEQEKRKAYIDALNRLSIDYGLKWKEL